MMITADDPTLELSISPRPQSPDEQAPSERRGRRLSARIDGSIGIPVDAVQANRGGKGSHRRSLSLPDSRELCTFEDKAKPSLWKRVIGGRCTDDGEEPLYGDEISAPKDFVHEHHGTFDETKVRFSGLPSEWNNQAAVFHKQFGVPLQSVPKVAVQGYMGRIPAVLVVLRRQIEEMNGFAQEGVFRVSADKSRQQEYRDQLDAGRFGGCVDEEDGICMASLVKEWFRALPEPLLNCVPREIIMRTGKAEDQTYAALELALSLREPNCSIFLWLLDLLKDAAAFSEKNRMSAKALAIVLAPNLYSVPDGSSPMEMMALMDAAVNAVESCLNERIAGTLQLLKA